MLTYDLDRRGKTPIYEYIYNCIREDILGGRLEPGYKLPSKRDMAVDNGVALITVENAYAQLILEGYVEAKPRRGYFVTDSLPMDMSNSVEQIALPSTIITKSIPESTMSEQADSLSPYDSLKPYDSFPYATWARLMRQVLTDREMDFSISPPSEGVYELRLAIANYLHNAKNLTVDPDCIIVGPGTEYLHSILLQVVGRNRLVAVEDPGYKKVSQIYEGNGMKVMHIPLDSEGLDVNRLIGSGIRLVHTSPAHHFPTGTVMSAPRRHKLISWAKDQEAYIIEDDYDSEFRFKGRPLPTLMSLDREHVVYMNTFTGTLAPSIRIAYMVLPQRLMDLYRKRLFFISGTVSTFEQLTLARFISEGFYERHIGRMRNRYRHIRDTYAEAMKASKLGNVAEIIEDPAGLHMIIRVQSGQVKENVPKPFISMTNYCTHVSKNYKGTYIIRYMDLELDTVVRLFDELYDALF